MNDNVQRGISANRNAGQLRNAENLEKRKSGIGKRSNYSAGISSISSFNPSLSSIAKNSIGNSIKYSSKNGSNEEAKKRLNREKLIKNTIKVAEKVPVLSKYAKAAKMASKVTQIKNKKGGFLSSLLGGQGKASNAEIEDANAAEQKGEEYKPEDTEGRFSTKLLDRRTKLIFIGVLAGILSINILVCVLIASAVTGGAKEPFLASHDNPSESEVESAYNADEERVSNGESDNPEG